jgi:hypothetical protein
VHEQKAITGKWIDGKKIPLGCSERVLHRFGSSDANAFRTFDWEIPNCLAILAGVMPALKAERTAFT